MVPGYAPTEPGAQVPALEECAGFASDAEAGNCDRVGRTQPTWPDGSRRRSIVIEVSPSGAAQILGLHEESTRALRSPCRLPAANTVHAQGSRRPTSGGSGDGDFGHGGVQQ